MTEIVDAWYRAPGEWVALSKLPEMIERELLIPKTEAIQSIRHPLETQKIESRVEGWNDHSSGTRAASNFPAEWVSRQFEVYRPTRIGWQSVDLTAGTLAGCVVYVRWIQVRVELSSLEQRYRKAARERETTKATYSQPPAELARIWMLGYATGINACNGKTPKRDDETMKKECQQATGCTVNDVRDAYSSLPRPLRNPSPTERQAAHQARAPEKDKRGP